MEFETQRFSSFMPTSGELEEVEKCKKKFVESFMIYVQYLYGAEDKQHKKYKLRLDLFNIKAMDILQSLKYTGRSLQIGSRPDCFQKCARATTCERYHMLDISWVFQKLLEGKGAFKCPECNTMATQTKHIIPDYFSYLYYTATEGASIQIIFNRQTKTFIPEILKNEIYETDDKIITNNTTIVTLFFDNYSPSFKKYIAFLDNQHLLKSYKIIRSEINESSLTESQIVRSNNLLFNLGFTSFSLVSLITGKRMRAGVIHQECRHSQIYIFDLEGLLLSLYRYKKEDKVIIEPKQSVKCIYCTSEFIIEKLEKKAMYFGKINNIVTQLPFSNGRAYFEANNLVPRGEQNVIKQKQRLIERNKQKKKEIQTTGYKNLTRRAVSFWNNQDRQRSEKLILQTLEKVKGKIGNCFSKSIDYNNTFYPVRCNSCKSLDFVDLYDELIHFTQLKQLQTNDDYKCLTCKSSQFDENEEEPEKDIYLDLEVYLLMQYKVVHIAFYPHLQRWLPDINNIQIKKDEDNDPITFILMYLKVNNKSSRDNRLPYYKNSFKMTKNLTSKNECFILDECIRSQGEDLHQHIIFVEKEAQKYTKPQCPKCGKVPDTILSLNYDENLVANMKMKFNEWNADLRQFKKFTKFRVIPGVASDYFTFLQEMFVDDYKKLPATAVIVSSKPAWSENEVLEHAGGITIFTQSNVEMLKVS